MKKMLSMIMIVVGVLGLLLSVAVLANAVYGTFFRPSPAMGIIGGADGPTLLFLLPVWFQEWQFVIYAGIILVIVGIVLRNKRDKS